MSKIPELIVQLQKYFPRVRQKRGEGTGLTNSLLLHEELVEDVILNVKDNMEVLNQKISK